VSGNKQQLSACAIGCAKQQLFHKLVVCGLPENGLKMLFSTLSPVIFATATVWHLYYLAILG